MKFKQTITISRLVVFTSVFLTLFYNIRFFKNVIAVYPVFPLNINAIYVASTAIILTCVLIFLITLISSKYLIKPVLIVILLISSLANYFMNLYNIIIDDSMIQNIVETSVHESMDLLSLKLLIYLFVFGIIPSFIIYKIKIKHGTLKTEFLSRLKLIVFSLTVVVLTLLSCSRFYTSFFREHKPLRYFTNPATWIYAIEKYTTASFHTNNIVVSPIGTDAKTDPSDKGKKLIICVVGESLREDRLSLNGYDRETTPLLEKEEVISFTDMYSCGTSTAVSVPCMFSIFDRDDYSKKKGESNENLLDILHHAGVHVLWRDNNSSSKGTALRVPYEDFRHPDRNPICEDGECRDEGMLVDLQDYIDKFKNDDIFIVLHQMGNHGPAYYKRYPKSFEKFKPVCRTNQLEECTSQGINNAYDNAVLYTDYFLSKVIELLKQNAARYETAMIYVSDHGESLGGNEIYLHGLPYYMAPDAQKHIAAIMWFGNRFQIDGKSLRSKSASAFSQDNLFHTILGLMKIKTSVYDKNLDIINYDK